MTLKGLLDNLLPPQRRPLTFAAALPLVIFLAVIGPTCFLLDHFDKLTFIRPRAFWLLLAVPWLWWLSGAGYSGLSRGRATAALIIRLLLAGLLIMLLAEPRTVRTSNAMTLMFVLDQSMSVGDEIGEQALEYVAKVAAEKPQKDQVGLIMFGDNAAVEMPPSKAPALNEGLTMTLQIDRDGTNIEKSLSLGGAVIPHDQQGRIVLISDGVKTDGDVQTVLDDLKARGIPVDVVQVDYEYDHEVWIHRLELPRNVKTGENYEASAIISSQADGRGELVLLENGVEIFREEVEYTAGKNRFDIPIYLREPGYWEYTALILPEKDAEGKVKDGVDKNNTAISYIHLKGKGKVLVVFDPADSANRLDWQPMVRTLREADRAVQTISAYEFSTDPLSLLPYDCVVFIDVPADAFVATQFTALKAAVMNQGTGFLMVGGENSFGPGGYHRSEVEEILPVSMDVKQRKVLPKGALAIVLHTCEFANGNTWGKRIAKQAINVLGEQDEAGVLVYDNNGGEKWLFELTPVSQRAKMATAINSAQIGDMPDFASTMRMALQGFAKSDAATKHMIIISDGDAGRPPPPLLQQYVDAKITVSTVAISPHGRATGTLQWIAGVTGGNFYFPNNPNKLPSIFIKEAKTLKRSMIQNITFTPAIAEYGLPTSILKGIDAFPQLHGYVITSPKPPANMVLTVPESEDEDPLLATWRIGTGQTAAFTSDLGANWARDWLEWEKFNAFVKQMIIALSRVRMDGDLRMQAYAGSGKGVVIVEDYAKQAGFLDVEAQIAGPQDVSQRIKLKQVGPRRYEGHFPLSGQGRYQIMAGGAGGGREEQVHGGFVVPYSQEYLRFRADPNALREIAAKTDGDDLDGDETAEEIFARDRRETKTDAPAADWFLILLACLVPLDVAWRRVQIDWNLLRARRVAPSDETFSQLLRTKRTVRTAMDEQRQTTPTGQGELLAKDQRGAPGKASRTAQKPAESDQATSTTERLLAARKRVQDEHGEEQRDD